MRKFIKNSLWLLVALSGAWAYLVLAVRAANR